MLSQHTQLLISLQCTVYTITYSRHTISQLLHFYCPTFCTYVESISQHTSDTAFYPMVFLTKTYNLLRHYFASFIALIERKTKHRCIYRYEIGIKKISHSLFFLSSCAWRGKSRPLALNFRCLFLLYSQKIVLLFYSLFYNKIVGPFTALRNRIQLINILYLDRLCTSECYF